MSSEPYTPTSLYPWSSVKTTMKFGCVDTPLSEGSASCKELQAVSDANANTQIKLEFAHSSLFTLI